MLTTLAAWAVGWFSDAGKGVDVFRKGFLIRPIDHGADIVGRRGGWLRRFGMILTCA